MRSSFSIPMPFLLMMAPLAVLTAAGCSAGEQDGAGSGVAGESEVLLETPEFEVGTGDVFECFYTDVITDRAMATIGAFGKQVGQGGHHITIYYTMDRRDPEHHPCIDEEMLALQQIGVTGSEGAGDIVLGDGLAMEIPAGAQFVLQTHYINTGEPFRVSESAGITLVDPADVIEYVHQFVVFEGNFTVPPHETLEVSGTCTVPSDLQIVRLAGHMHEWGTRYQLAEVDEAGEVVRSLIDDEVTPVYASHPPIAAFGMEDPLVLPAGTRLRQTCNWNNYDDFELVFPREMCLAFALFFGGEGEDATCIIE